MKLLVVVDMQRDFINGSLGTKDAENIISNVKAKVEEYIKASDGFIIFTQDTHHDNYLETEEGKHLQVPHCIEGTEGWEIPEEIFGELKKFKHGDLRFHVFQKETFGSDMLRVFIESMNRPPFSDHNLQSIELIGLCTDICVSVNAAIAKTAAPNVPIYVDASCCAGSTPEKHTEALDIMESFHINIINR